MSNAVIISRDLVAAGFTQAQAEAVVQAVATYTSETLATKSDVAEIKTAVKIGLGLILGLYAAIFGLHLATLFAP